MITGKNTAVYGIYGSRTSVESAVSLLEARGFRPSDVSVLFPEGNTTKEFAHEKATKAPEGAAAGAGTGGILGGALGWLAGIGTLAIPAVGPFIAAGPIVGLLAGAGLGGAIGAIGGALIGMGLPEYEAVRYEGMIKRGGILLSVHADNKEWAEKAKGLLEETGARDIGMAGEHRGDFNNTDRPTRKSA